MMQAVLADPQSKNERPSQPMSQALKLYCANWLLYSSA